MTTGLAVVLGILLSVGDEEGRAAAPPTAREVFLAGLAELEGVTAREFPARLERFVDERTRIVDESPDRTRLRRRALLIGLGALFDAGDAVRGTPLIGRMFEGVVRDDEKARRDRICTHTRLHGRHDAPKHFFLAAALTARGGPAAAAQASLVKEIEDARRLDAEPPRGTGFSYLDLAYDHAGIRFANRLLGWRDPDALTARAPALDRFLPPFPDLELAEGIGWKRFREEYRGERTQAILDRIHGEIDRRLAPRDPVPEGDRSEDGPETRPPRAGESESRGSESGGSNRGGSESGGSTLR